MPWFRGRERQLLPALLAVLVAVLGIATNIATDMKESWVAWAIWGALVGAVAVGTAVIQHASQTPESPHPSTRADRASAVRVDRLKQALKHGQELEHRAARSADPNFNQRLAVTQEDVQQWRAEVEVLVGDDARLLNLFRHNDPREFLWANLEVDLRLPPLQVELRRRNKALQEVINELSV